MESLDQSTSATSTTENKTKKKFDFKSYFSRQRAKSRNFASPIKPPHANTCVRPQVYPPANSSAVDEEEPWIQREAQRFREYLNQTEKNLTEPSQNVPTAWASSGKPVTTALINHVAKKLQRNTEAFTVHHEVIPREMITENRVFIYDVRSMNRPDDFFWRCDEFTWDHERTVTLPINPLPGQIQWKVAHFKLISGGNKVPFQRREYRRIGQGFEVNQTWDDPHVYVAYTGVTNNKTKIYECFDLDSFVPKSRHGNEKAPEETLQSLRLRELVDHTPGNTPSKCNAEVHLPAAADSEQPTTSSSSDQGGSDRVYHRSTVSVKLALKDALERTHNPMVAHAEVKRNALLSGARPTSIPRNRQQVYEVNRARRQQQQLKPVDPLWEVLMTSQRSPEMIPLAGYEEGKAFALVVAPDLIAHVNRVLDNKDYVVLHQDTTYNVGVFYTTIVTIKHPYFVGHPGIPVAFLFHQSKIADMHRRFMEILIEKMPKLNSKLCVIITDREGGIRKPLVELFDKAFKATCHEHILRNVSHWLSGHSKVVDSDIHSVLKNDIRALLRSSTASQFDELESGLLSGESVWPEAFVQYYLVHLKDDIRQTARFNTEPLGVYYPSSGVSNNQSESINSTFKHFAGKDAPKDWMEAVMKAYFVMADSYNDMYLAVQHKMGDLTVKEGYMDKLKAMDIEVHPDALGETGRYAVFRDGKYITPATREDVCDSDLKYKDGLADWLIKENRVFIVNGQFFVRSLLRKTYYVNHITGECTCGKYDCMESRAVDRVIRLSDMIAARKTQYKKPLKRNTLTSRNKNAVKPTTGKKAHVRIGPRSSVIGTLAPKPRAAEASPDVNADGDVSTFSPPARSKQLLDCGEFHVNAEEPAHSAMPDKEVTDNLSTVIPEQGKSIIVVRIPKRSNVPKVASPESIDEDARGGENQMPANSPVNLPPGESTDTHPSHDNAGTNSSMLPLPTVREAELPGPSAVPSTSKEDLTHVSALEEKMQINAGENETEINEATQRKIKRKPAQAELGKAGGKRMCTRLQKTAVKQEADTEVAKTYCICQRPEDDYMFLCSNPMCTVGWYHGKCLNLPKDQLKILARKKSLRWHCLICSYDC